MSGGSREGITANEALPGPDHTAGIAWRRQAPAAAQRSAAAEPAGPGHLDPGRRGLVLDLVLDPLGQPRRASAGTNFAASIVPHPLARS